MQKEVSTNKTIAKNTMLLYARMVFMMLIGLYTTRVILNALGVSDLGLMNVSGSVVAMFTFLNGTLQSGTMRFLTYALGKGDKKKLQTTFSCAMTLHLVMALLIVLLCETIGLWYLYNHLICEPNRFNAAVWCFHLSVLSTFISILLVPFNSVLIAHEHMNMYAYMGIYDAAYKLLAAYLITIVPWDRVIFYSTLSFILGLIPTFIYNWYCRKHFTECRFCFGYDKVIFKKMLTFSGWNTIGCLADMGRGTGINIILNAFYGTIVNGANGIAGQANGWIYKFVDSFIAAIRPQVTKSYASGDFERMSNLVCNGSMFAAYLYLFLGIPLFIEIEWILTMWLGHCPEHTVAFLRIIMVQLLFQTLGHLTVTAMHATGQMKIVNLTVGIILLTIVPIGYIIARLGYSSETVMAVCVIPWIIVPIVRIHWINKYSGGYFPIRRYLYQCYYKVPTLAILMFIPPFLTKLVCYSLTPILCFLCVGLISILTSGMIIYYLGLTQELRTKTILRINNTFTFLRK